VNSIDDFVSASQLECDVIQVWRIRGPQLWVWNLQRGKRRGFVCASTPLGNSLAIRGDLRMKAEPGGGIYNSRIKAHSTVNRWCDANLFQMNGMYYLQPDALANATRTRVEDASRFWLPILLAARNRPVRWRVFGAHHHYIRAAVQQVRNVKPKRCIPAFVIANEIAIHPNSRAVIDCAEAQDNVLALPIGGYGEGPAIPSPWMKTRVADSAEFAFEEYGTVIDRENFFVSDCQFDFSPSFASSNSKSQRPFRLTHWSR
jgi:hypothetical protein